MYHFLSGYTAKVAGTERASRAEGDLQHLLPARRSCRWRRAAMRDARREDRAPRRAGVAREHRLDRRAVRRRQAMAIAYTRAMIRAAPLRALDRVAYETDPISISTCRRACPMCRPRC